MYENWGAQVSDNHVIAGKAAPLNIANLDTDQIMPKQFLRGIDKKGLDKGVLWDLRFDGEGGTRPNFILNRLEYSNTKILITGPNFGCGSSREHAVWGLQQYGIQAVIGSSFGEIFFSNAMNNGLLAVILPQEDMAPLIERTISLDKPFHVEIDVKAKEIRILKLALPFEMSERHRNMFIEGVDMIGATLAYKADISEFSTQHWIKQPWLRDVAQKTKQRLDSN